MMNILILGGTRFMGAVTVRQLIDDSHQVTVFHRGHTDNNTPDAVRHIHGDRDRLTDFAEEFATLAPDVIIDMTARTKHHARDLLAVMPDTVRRLVMISSADVYRSFGLLLRTESGDSIDGPLAENAPLRENFYPYRNVVNPGDDLYDYDKILIEQAVLNNDQTPVTIIRPPMVHGPNDPQHRLYSYLKRMQDNRPAIILDMERLNWQSTRGYRDDLAHAIYLAARDHRDSNYTYNVAYPTGLTEREWIKRIAAEMKWDGAIIGLPNHELPDYLQTPYDWSRHLVMDSTAIRSDLGFTEPVDFDDALRRTVKWELANPPRSTPDKFDYEAEDAAINLN